MLALCGVNLMILQYVMLRELATLLTGIELVVLLLVAAFFSGFSVGYALSGRLSARAVRIALAGLFGLHLTLPFGPRWLAGWLAAHGARAWTLAAMLFVAAFLLSSVYSVFLPRLIGPRPTPGAVRRGYAAELTGSLAGLALAAAVMRAGRLLPLMLTYFAVLIAIMALEGASSAPRGRRALVAASLAGVVAYGLAFPPLDRLSIEYFFRHAKGFTVARSLFQWYSPYQKIDVIENGRGERFLYLDGLLYWSPTKLEAFNFYLSELPARLQGRARVLIVGSGSMSSVRHVAPFARAIETVEIDAAVVDAGRRFFARENGLAGVPHWTVTIDDAKHFLGRRPDAQYDLVIMDVPAPTSVPAAMLHSHEFYTLVGRHLTPHGIVSVSLCGELRPDHPTSPAVAASVLRAFPQAWAVTGSSPQQSFAVAGNHLAFSRADIERILAARPGERFAVFDRRQIEDTAGGATAISLRRPEVVLTLNLRRVNRLYGPAFTRGT